MSAIRELGKQWSLEARLVEGHKLVTMGVYSWVRHPIYTAMLGKLIATGIVISHWLVVLIAIVIFLIGTFIRTRFEERLLGDAFGEEFTKWKARVPGFQHEGYEIFRVVVDGNDVDLGARDHDVARRHLRDLQRTFDNG